MGISDLSAVSRNMSNLAPIPNSAKNATTAKSLGKGKIQSRSVSILQPIKEENFQLINTNQVDNKKDG